MTISNAINNVQFTSVNIVTFTSNGTYTPPANLLWAQVECVGAGGGAAGQPATGPTTLCVSGAGGGGGYVRKVYARSSLTPNVSVTVGSGGAGGAAGTNNGSPGGSTTFIGLTGAGGNGGLATTASSAPAVAGVAGGTASGGDVNIPGGSTMVANYGDPSRFFEMSQGGTSYFSASTATGTGATGNSYGGGGGGSWRDNSASAIAGNAGQSGVVLITEFLAF